MNCLRLTFLTLLFFLILAPHVESQGHEENKTALLTVEERKWLAEHPQIRLSPDPDFPPIDFFDDGGKYMGIAADYVGLLEETLGIKFKIVHLQSWSEVLEKARDREIDVLPAATKTPERSKYLSFTAPYLKLPSVIIVRKKVRDNLTQEDLNGMKVAVVSGYSSHEYLVTHYPQIKIDPVADIPTGLRKVSFGMGDAFVGNIATATYYIEKEGITNLKIARNTGHFHKQSFASRNDWPILNKILEKGLSQINEEEREAIYRKWVHLEQAPSIVWKKFLVPLLAGLGGILLVMIGIISWNRSLKRQVDQRTVELEQELGERKRAEEDLRRYRDHLEEQVMERTRELEEKALELGKANRRLKEADRLKTVFLASMSHELRTPLNSIIGFTGIVLQGMSGKINDEQQKQLTMVKKSGNHLLSLINDLLDIAKIEAEKVDLSIDKFTIGDVITEVVESFSPAVEEKGLEVTLDVPQGVTLLCDRRRLKQVLMNFVSNAVKFTDQGSISIAIRVIEDEKVEVSVIDTGIGIKDEVFDKLFQPFQQVGESLTRSREGTGLGLHLTKKLVGLLGGDVSAKSTFGKGAEFTFTVPLTP